MRRSIIISNPARLSLDKNRLAVRQGEQINFVPIEDIELVVIDNVAVELTTHLLAALAQIGATVTVCDSKHLPTATLHPHSNNVLTAQILKGQIGAKQPSKKRIWQAIIAEKIRAQARLLQEITNNDHGLHDLAKSVKSGDTTNRESRAAYIYFPVLFGQGFIRQRQDEVLLNEQHSQDALINSLLNYGYAILRAAVARHIIAAGLNPILGIHHHHRNNPHALADDLMEPLRTLVDREVIEIMKGTNLPDELNPELKRQILSILTCEIYWKNSKNPLDIALDLYCSEVRRCLLNEISVPHVPSG